MMEWLAAADSVPMEVIIYGKRLQAGGPAAKVADTLHHSRGELLKKKLESAPEHLREFYEKKLAYVQVVEDKVHNAALVESLVVEHFERGCLDTLEGALRDRDYLVGSSYTLADACWTMILQRTNDLGLGRRFWADGKRPKVEGYLRRMLSRPSFDRAVTSLVPKSNSSPNLLPGQRKGGIFRSPWFWGGLVVTVAGVVAAVYLNKGEKQLV